MKEFFGIGGYKRTPEGYMSWQHLLFVGSLLFLMTLIAVWLGMRNRHKTAEEKKRCIIAAAILYIFVELFKLTVLCLSDGSPEPLLYNLPLFLCSIQLIAIPLAAFTKGRVQEASMDFVAVFGWLGAVFGTVAAGQNYNAYPVISFNNVVSGLTHCISGFASLYVLITGLASLKKRNIAITYVILTAFCVVAYIANITIPYNYMFLMAGDGTPYDILYNLFNGNKILYPLSVVMLFVIYIAAFYWVFYLFSSKKESKVQAPELAIR